MTRAELIAHLMGDHALNHLVYGPGGERLAEPSELRTLYAAKVWTVATLTERHTRMHDEPWFPLDDRIATKDANGNDLGYPGPDGKTLYFRGFPVGSPTDWERIQRENKIGRWRST